MACALVAVAPPPSAEAQNGRSARPAQQQPAPAADPNAILAVDARLESQDATARFSITMSREVTARAETLAQPPRIVLELPEIAFQAAQEGARRAGLVKGFRAGLVGPGRSRIVFDLAGPARIAQMRMLKRGDGLSDMVVDFERATPAAFDAAVGEGAERRAREALRPLQLQPREPQDKRPVVVIDPGHGGIDPGAVARGGVVEKAIVLAIGARLRDAIKATGGVRVLMTREDDRFLSLADRVRMAREAQADLFISLHADSLSAAQEVRGATVYTGSERATDAESARLAQKENAADALGGADTSGPGEEVAEILMDLSRRETRASSAAAAARLVTEMSGAVRMHRIPHRAAGFRVLTAPDVPSVLIELGYLSSKNDIELLTSPEWQQKAADAIARAVLRQFTRAEGQGPAGASISP